jgi:hypothetical protein
MRKNVPVVRSLAAGALFFLAALLASCIVVVLPKDVPLARTANPGSYNGASLIVTNSEKDAASTAIRDDAGSKQGFTANRQAWSRKLVEAMARELARRGAQVRAGASVTIDIAVPEITITQLRDDFRCKVKVRAGSSAGWTKLYEAVAQTSVGSFEPLESMADRLAGLALTEAVKVILGDPEFAAQAGKK